MARDKTFVRGSYTWSQLLRQLRPGQLDHRRNDANIFIGSSNIADGAGRQLWNFKDGTLRGDRRTCSRSTALQAAVERDGRRVRVAQSGQPWETWSYEPYIALTTSTSDTNRFAEKAGSRRTRSHYQLDLNYTQNFRFGKRLNAAARRRRSYNVFDKQTATTSSPAAHSSTFGSRGRLRPAAPAAGVSVAVLTQL